MHEKSARVFPGRLHGKVTDFLGPRQTPTQFHAGRETCLGLVGAYLDDQFATHAVRLGDPPYDEFH
jgi:hypothetical protein